MKPISNDYFTKIIGSTMFSMAEMYTIKLVDGSMDYFTSLDNEINYNGVVFKSHSLIIEQLHYKASVGWSVDEQTVRIFYRPEDMLCGANFIGGVVEGMLDGATITRQRAFWPRGTDYRTFADFLTAPLDVITLFTGYVAAIDKIGQTEVEVKIRSPMGLLDIDMPRNTYQSGCQWRLFDHGCTLNRDDYTVTGSVAGVSDGNILVSGGVSPNVGADGDAYFAQGRIKFTSGDRTDLTLTIRDNDDSYVYFMYPPIKGIHVGDEFFMWPGCSKRTDTCKLKFNNIANFRGFPKIPPVVTSI